MIAPTLPASRDAGVEPTAGLSDRGLGRVLLAAGGLGLVAAFVLAVEKFLLLTNPLYTPSCTVNATFSCGAVMSSPAAEAFGFPNPLLGIAGFAVVTTTGVVLAAGSALPQWYWAGLQAGATAGLVFVGWLAYQSVAVIGAFCPYCLVVWACTLTAFWYVTLHNLATVGPRLSGRARAMVDFVTRFHSSLLAGVLLALALGVGVTAWLE